MTVTNSITTTKKLSVAARAKQLAKKKLLSAGQAIKRGGKKVLSKFSSGKSYVEHTGHRW